MRFDPHDAEEPRSIDQLFAQVSKLHRNLVHNALINLGLHRGQPQLLFALMERDGQTHSQLAEQLMVTPSTITRMVQRMERAGFVERRPDAADERLSRVFLSPGGRNVEAALRDLWKKMEAEAFAGLSAEERANMDGYLRRMRDNLLRAAARLAASGPTAGAE